MREIEFDTSLGIVVAKNVMIDTDGTNLEEGIEIFSEEEFFESFTVIGYDVNDLSDDDIEEFIKNKFEEEV